MGDSLLSAAVRANAEWCDLMCRAHDIVGTFADDAWTTAIRSPMFYPDAVTLAPGEVSVLDRIDTSPGCSIKDSFATLAPSGFSKLFDAEWIARPPAAAASTYTFEWSMIGSPIELAAFDEAFGGSDLFIPALLQSPQVAVFAGRHSDRVVAGCVANISGPVVGLSNVFGPEDVLAAVWVDVVGAVAARFPDMPIVGYERELDLDAAKSCGFEPIGPLRVWYR